MAVLRYNKQLHEELISGRKRAIAWGRSQDAHIRLHTASYEFEAVIDGMRAEAAPEESFAEKPVWGPTALNRLDPAKYVIVVMADAKQFGAQICEQVADYGDFELTLPFDPSRHIDQQALSEQLISAVTPGTATTQSKDNDTVVLCLPNLFKGGADKQMVLLALGLTLLSKKVYLVTHGPDAKGTEDWQAMLEFHGVVRVFAPELREQSLDALCSVNQKLTGLLPPRFVNLFNTLVNTIEGFKPSLVVSFLDNANILASLAASRFPGIKVVLSGRSQAPVNVPGFSTMLDFPVMQKLYQHGLQNEEVSLVCNSPSGQQSYGQWLEDNGQDIKFIENAVYLEKTEHQPIRQTLGFSESGRLVCGVMRLIDSKRPLDFVRGVHQAHLKFSDICAVIVGDGPMYAEVAKCIASLNAQAYIKLVGLQESALPYLAVSDAFLHTSCVEGTANVLLEAQAMGLPVFAYEAKETRHAVRKAELHMADDGDVDGLAALIATRLEHRTDKYTADGNDFSDAIRMAREYLAQSEEGEDNSLSVKRLG